ncbi:MAG: hypothetical protein QNJ47_25185 [Nostocaceae cyanobacterium]|nr:hypothetical protein [Nostocaceae cyanobacterium]
MNVKLLESLAQVIKSLTPEEQAFLEEILNQQKLLQQEQQQREQLRQKISERRKGKPFEPNLDEYIQITRNERTAQQDELLRDCLGEKSN